MGGTVSIDRLREEIEVAFYRDLDLDRALALVDRLISWVCSFGQSTPVHTLAECTRVAELCIDVLAQKDDDVEAGLHLANRIKSRSRIIEFDGLTDIESGVIDVRIELLQDQALLRTHEFGLALEDLKAMIEVLENVTGVELGRGFDTSLDGPKLATLLSGPYRSFAYTYRQAIALALFASFACSVRSEEHDAWPPRSWPPPIYRPLQERAAVVLATSPQVPDNDRAGYHAVAFMRAFCMAALAQTAQDRRMALAALDVEAKLRPHDAHGELFGSIALAYRARLEGGATEADEHLAGLTRRLRELGFGGYLRDLGLCSDLAESR